MNTIEQLARWIESGSWTGHSAYEHDQLRAIAATIRRLAAENAALRKDAERLDFVELFSREPDEWERKHGRCKNGDVWCWTFYSPKGVQGSTRSIIDAARAAMKEQP